MFILLLKFVVRYSYSEFRFTILRDVDESLHLAFLVTPASRLEKVNFVAENINPQIWQFLTTSVGWKKKSYYIVRLWM